MPSVDSLTENTFPMDWSAVSAKRSWHYLTASRLRAIENLAGLEDSITMFGIYSRTHTNQKMRWETVLTWSQTFFLIAPYLIRRPTDDSVKNTLTKAAFGLSNGSGWGHNEELNDQLFRTIAVQLQALNLVEIKYGSNNLGYKSLYWSLTPYGERLMLELRTVKKTTLPKTSEQQSGD
jgi:hypothetical protein